MGKDVCTFMPTVNGKASKLFSELKKRTNSQSSAAFLYAIAKDDSITSQFEKKDFDGNGQLLYKAFADKFNLDNFIASRTELLQERRREGVVNQQGNQVIFNDPDILFDKITTYNNSQDRFKMKMRWSAASNGYVIDLERVGIDNYKTNEIMQTDMARFRGYISYLERILGKPIRFNDTVRRTFANYANIRYFEDVVLSLAKNLKQFGKKVYLTENQAALLVAFHGDSPIGQRIQNIFGDNLISVLVETSRLKEGDPDEMDQNLRNLLRNFIREAANRATASNTLASKFSAQGFLDAGKRAVTDANIQGKEYFGINPETLNDAINELRSKYLIDKEIKNGSLRAIKSLSDIAENLMQVNIRQMEKLERLGKRDEDYVNHMETLRKLYNKGKYVDSIAGMLEEFDKGLTSNAALLNEALDSLNSGIAVSSIQGLNKVSAAVLDTLKLSSACSDILDNLIHLNGLDIDENDVSHELLEKVRETARDLSSRLKDQVLNARRKQFDVLYAFYLPIWGGTDIKIDPQGGEHSLRDILEVLAEDPNILDRLIYSLNESNDEALGLLHQAVLDRQRARDEMMRKVDFFIRTQTDNLYQTGRNSSFMFETDENGLTGRIIDPYGISRYKKARQEKIEELRGLNLTDEQFRAQLFKWEKDNTRHTAPFTNFNGNDYQARYERALRNVVSALFGVTEENVSDYGIDVLVVPSAQYMDDKLNGLSEAELDYYFNMMALKSVMQKGMPNYDTNFFEAPQMTNDFVSTIMQAGSSPGKMFSAMTNYFSFSSKRVDENYEETLGDLLHGNGYKRVLEDIDGSELMRLPLFFTHRLKDRSNMSTDFSRTMLAMSSAAVNYNELNSVLDTLMLTKDWLLTKRQQDKVEGERRLVDLFKWGKDIFMQSVMKEQNSEASLIVDFFEKDVYGKLKKDEEVNIFGTTVKLDKAADWLTGFTSRTGLTVNILGAQANALVGKLQMTIEGACGQYFDLGDMGYAEVKYWQMVMPYLMEYNSNNKTSTLGLLSEKFNVMEGYYQDLRQKGFQISALGKILSNTNLFLLYGIGEHMLHNETMLAILHRVKVRKVGTEIEMNMLQAYEQYGIKGNERNKIVDLTYSDFEIQQPDGTWKAFTKQDEEKIEKQIAYCNKTMHGAFSDADKGMAHRYAFGRMVMNFRQWMPGHYGRRYRTMHYDADLGEYVSGFYQSAFKFAVDTVNDLKRMKFDIGTRWKELSAEEQANIKRAIAETALLTLLTVQNLCLGEYKDKRGSWAYRNLIYQTKRMLMEVRASTPLSGFGSQGFISNMVSMLNSPVAAITTIEDIVNLMNLSKLFITIEGGRYDGENLYIHNLKRRIPYIGQIVRQSRIGEEDYIFQVFE